jgi:DNA polymerase I-like protein with 3'-5' exonuclease and polymerase domains
MTERVLVFDIETTGEPAQVGKLLSVAWKMLGETETQVARADDTIWHGPGCTLGDLLANPNIAKVTHTKYDVRYLKLQGWEVVGPYYDTQVMAWVLNENQMLSLDVLAKRYLHKTMDKRLKKVNKVLSFTDDGGKTYPLTEFELWPVYVQEQFLAYNVRDVDDTADLFEVLLRMMEDTAWEDFWREECVPLTEVLIGMEVAGLPINLEDSEEFREELEVKHAEMAAALKRDAGLPDSFNLNSGPAMARYLFELTFEMPEGLRIDTPLSAALKEVPRLERLEYVNQSGTLPDSFVAEKVGRLIVHGTWHLKGRALPPTERTPAGDRWSTASPVLRSNFALMTDPWVVRYLEYRRVDKALTTYLRKYPVLAQGGRLYGRFNQTGTKTGRLSSSEPNLQNQPAHGELGERMRGLFQGRLVVGDYSQLEPRLMAHFSEDPLLLDIYRSDRDIYLATAEGIFGHTVAKDDVERGIAKTLVLAMGYGAAYRKVAQILTINGFPTTPETAKDYLAELHALYATFFSWRQAVITRVKLPSRGYVQTLSGRHRRLKAAFTDRRNWKNIGYGERQAVNAIVQGSAGDIVARVMVRGNWQHEQLLLAQVHDELVWEWTSHVDPSPQQLEYIQHVGQTAHGFALNVPLKFEPHFGPSWFAAKEGIVLPEDLNEETEGFEE